MASQVQNSGAALAVQTFDSMVKELERGEANETAMAMEKLKRSRKFGIAQQSTSQMTSRLTLGVDEGWDYIRLYGQRLGEVSQASIGEAFQGCSDHAILTLEGPVEVVSDVLDEAGIEYTIVDWEGEAEGLLAQYYPKELKRKKKRDAKREKEEALAEEDSTDEEPTETPAEETPAPIASEPDPSGTTEGSTQQ